MQFFIFVIPNQYYVRVFYPSRELDMPLVLTLTLDETPPPLPTFLVLLDPCQYYEKSSLAVFLSFVYLSSTLWGTPRSTILYPGVTQLNVMQKGSYSYSAQ